MRTISYQDGYLTIDNRQLGYMRKHLHVLTDVERIVDPDGQLFGSLADAVAEASQCARDLMAEELRQGRPIPLSWRVQIASHNGVIEATLKFADIAVGATVSAHPGRVPVSVDPDLADRAVFFKARRVQSELSEGLRTLSENVRTLSAITKAVRRADS
jgi:hypothetical protein